MIDQRFVMSVVLGGLLAGCGNASRADAPPPPPVVRAEVVVEQDVPVSAEWVGTLVGSINAQIRPRVSGHLVSQNYKEGTVVKAGDLLFQVDPRPYQVALDQAGAQLLQAQSQLSQAKAQVSASQAQVEQSIAQVAQNDAEVTKVAADQRRTELNVARYTPLAQRGFVSQQELDNAVQYNLANIASVAAARASVQNAQASVANARATLEKAQADANISDDERREQTATALAGYEKLDAAIKQTLQGRAEALTEAHRRIRQAV